MPSPPAKEQSHQKLNHELRDVISILTGLGKSTTVGADEAHGIITLAGTNKGAMMKMEGSETAMEHTSTTVSRNGGGEGSEAFANSNYQSINNSIVIGGSCGAEDPGVHLLIQDYVEGEDDEYHEAKKEKKKDMDEKEKKKKEKSEDGKEHAEEDRKENGDK